MGDREGSIVSAWKNYGLTFIEELLAIGDRERSESVKGELQYKINGI